TTSPGSFCPSPAGSWEHDRTDEGGLRPMPLNQSFKGKAYQPVSFTVERDRVVQFADAIGEDAPVFRDADAARAAGYAEQVAPPTLVTAMQIMTSGQVVLDQDLGLDYSRVVHGE